MSDTHQSSERKKSKELYTTPQLTVFGDVETLTRGSTPRQQTLDATSTPAGYPSKVRTPVPPKNP